MESIFYGIDTWQVLTIIAIVFVIGEVFIPGFILMPIGVGFLVTALLAPFVETYYIILTLLAINIVISLFVFKKWVVPKLKIKNLPTNVSNMIGKEVYVTETIDNSHNKGYIKLYGDSWKAQSKNEEVINVGTKVKICAVEGSKVIVKGV